MLSWQEEGVGMGWGGASAVHLDGGPVQPTEQRWFILAGDLIPCTLCPLRKGTKQSS